MNYFLANVNMQCFDYFLVMKKQVKCWLISASSWIISKTG